MIDLGASLSALAAVLAVALLAWVVSVVRRDVSMVDSLWSVFFLVALGAYLALANATGPRAMLILGLVGVWGLRLSVYITARNHGKPEDHRYREIRRNNQPNFWLKSLYIVFLFQGFLAWVMCLPALAAVSAQASLGPLDYAGVALWLVGMTFEVVGDYQLARFRKQRENNGKVLDSGLWRYTRHPNYFGEATIWWGIYLVALSAGAWWTVFAPLLMTFLLLRVSGVSLLEKDIADRRPAYREYIRRTNAFIPGRPRNPNDTVRAAAGEGGRHA
jgi:steroid 5-alpha reductase family enzyme